MKVAIDTNIFMHLFNERENEDSHIEQLLSQLGKHKFRLCVDSTKKIANEYYEHLEPWLRRKDDTGIQLYILRFWMNEEIRETIPTDPTDDLMTRIKRVIHEKDEHADRALVYISCKGDCCLVTNCKVHILDRKGELKKNTRKLRGKQSDILDSRSAIPHFSDQNLAKLLADEVAAEAIL
jgi:hypothetical protein